MRFDQEHIEPCVTPLPFGGIGTNGEHPGDGSIDPGTGGGTCTNAKSGSTDDVRCSDPIFAAANPQLCLGTPRLIVKPSVVTKEILNQVTFKAFLYINGGEEALTDNVRFSTTNPNIATVSAKTGATVGIKEGIATIAASYGGLSAFAQIQVVGGCETANTFHLLMDCSKSMSLPFSSHNPTRIGFAKKLAAEFADTVDLRSDHQSVICFDAAAMIKSLPTLDLAQVQSAINSIGTTQHKTKLRTGFEKAVEIEETGTRNVIVLFTDGGENQEAVTTLIPYVENLKSSGWVVIVVGFRAAGRDFMLLEQLATPGFFINATSANEDSVIPWLSGLKSYLCSGNCGSQLTGAFGRGQLNFGAFTNWDIVDGNVDLCGQVPGGIAVFDLMPGNGLYVDLCGSSVSPARPVDNGQMWSKDPAFEWTDGHTYRITITLAGNQRQDRSDDTVSLKVFGADGIELVNELIVITDYTQDFTQYAFDFAPSGAAVGSPGGKIRIMQTVVNGTFGAAGCFLGSVLLQDITQGDEAVGLFDNFDGENPQENPTPCIPAGGADYGYGYADCYSSGCLETPIPAQIPDTVPLPDVECG